ncbi:MAG: hypothetical protein MIO93_14785 [ANME-2 cluster archaeon]|jgi:hypothetical protein|nr:hypothetical protein [ANME-2 cluster archaeon]
MFVANYNLNPVFQLPKVVLSRNTHIYGKERAQAAVQEWRQQGVKKWIGPVLLSHK